MGARAGAFAPDCLQSDYGVGTLYFDVKPNGDIVGQEVSESSLRDVSRSAYEKQPYSLLMKS